MAKLNGVKTVDMANGEITKVSYDGSEYVKVGEFEGKTEVGNLLLSTEPLHGYFTKGAFYEVIRNGSDAVIDNEGDNPYICASKFKVFRKVSAQPSELQVGDTVKVSIPAGQRPAYGWGNVKNGDIGKVNAVFINSVTVEFPAHNSWTARLTELVKVAEDGYVRVIDRKPKAGDYVKFSEDGYDVTAGIYYEVTAIDEDGDAEFIDDAGDENSAVVDYETFEVYEKAGVVKVETLKVGDYAKVIQVGHRLNGKIVELKHRDIICDPDLKFFGEPVDGSWRDAFAEYHLVKATDAEHAEAKRKLAPKFSVGDYVKVIEACYEYKVGDVLKIIEDKNGPKSHSISSSFDFKIRNITQNIGGYARASFIEKISAEEAGKIEAEAKLAEQFAKLERKPNEFKVGDVVRVIDGRHSGFVGYEGITSEIDEYDGTSRPYHVVKPSFVKNEGINTWLREKDIELIAPVESRVDRQ